MNNLAKPTQVWQQWSSKVEFQKKKCFTMTTFLTTRKIVYIINSIDNIYLIWMHRNQYGEYLEATTRARGGGGAGGGGFSPPTFMEILQSYWEKSVFSSPPLWVTIQPPHFQSSSAGPDSTKFVLSLIASAGGWTSVGTTQVIFSMSVPETDKIKIFQVNFYLRAISFLYVFKKHCRFNCYLHIITSNWNNIIQLVQYFHFHGFWQRTGDIEPQVIIIAFYVYMINGNDKYLYTQV